jgi:hypothetical protein
MMMCQATASQPSEESETSRCVSGHDFMPCPGGDNTPNLPQKNKPNPQRSDGQVHPTASSALPCRPNVNATRLRAHTESTVQYHLGKNAVSTPPMALFRRLFSPPITGRIMNRAKCPALSHPEREGLQARPSQPPRRSSHSPSPCDEQASIEKRPSKPLGRQLQKAPHARPRELRRASRFHPREPRPCPPLPKPRKLSILVRPATESRRTGAATFSVPKGPHL